jgi:hypothetical protein
MVLAQTLANGVSPSTNGADERKPKIMTNEYYFAYGSNLNKSNWNNGKRIRFKEAFVKRSNAYLPDYKLLPAIPKGERAAC